MLKNCQQSGPTKFSNSIDATVVMFTSGNMGFPNGEYCPHLFGKTLGSRTAHCGFSNSAFVVIRHVSANKQTQRQHLFCMIPQVTFKFLKGCFGYLLVNLSVG